MSESLADNKNFFDDIIKIIEEEKDTYTLVEVKKLNIFPCIVKLDCPFFHADSEKWQTIFSEFIVKFYLDRDFMDKFIKMYNDSFYFSTKKNSLGLKSYIAAIKYLKNMFDNKAVNNELLEEENFHICIGIFDALVENKILKSKKYFNFILSNISLESLIQYIEIFESEKILYDYILKNFYHIYDSNISKFIKYFQLNIVEKEYTNNSKKIFDFFMNFLEKIEVKDEHKFKIQAENLYTLLCNYYIKPSNSKFGKCYEIIMKFVSSVNFYVKKKSKMSDFFEFAINDLIAESFKNNKIKFHYEINPEENVDVTLIHKYFDLEKILPFVDSSKLTDEVIKDLYLTYNFFENEYDSKFNYEKMKDTEIFSLYIKNVLPTSIMKNIKWEIIEDNIFQITILNYKYKLYGGNTCGICHEDIQNINYINILQCGHWLCCECFGKQEIEERNKCISRCTKDEIRRSGSS